MNSEIKKYLTTLIYILLSVQEVVAQFIYSNLLNQMGNYFLDIQYIHNICRRFALGNVRFRDFPAKHSVLPT